ncbi:MAG: hypothetical protein ACREUG_08340 [Steroidobacteraceae bacterium]
MSSRPPQPARITHRERHDDLATPVGIAWLLLGMLGVWAVAIGVMLLWVHFHG